MATLTSSGLLYGFFGLKIFQLRQIKVLKGWICISITVTYSDMHQHRCMYHDNFVLETIKRDIEHPQK